ncbi:MAG: DUF3810 domain-containing protein [Firmicutes bacterium]|nr:DUF3810 domain-containing protein [Bacillota bacterium]
MNKRSIPALLLLPAGLLLTTLAGRTPAVVEKLYSRSIYPLIGRLLSKATGYLPFSLAEVLVIGVLLTAIIFLLSAVRLLVKDKNRRWKRLVNFFFSLLYITGLLYLFFNLLWGLNYYREPLSTALGLEIRPASVAELEDLCRHLLEKANSLRLQVAENSDGVMFLAGGRDNVFTSAADGFDRAAALLPQLGGHYGKAKKVLFSEFLSYAGITGIYFPFTGEANINNTIPDYMLPATVCHEMAHQRGFAREDEANYLAYLACKLHPDPDYQYSGILLAVIHATNALRRTDPQRAKSLDLLYGEGVWRDLADWSAFWRQYEGPVENISREINDSYLKANRQADGVLSYNRMVSLLLAEFRQKQE